MSRRALLTCLAAVLLVMGCDRQGPDIAFMAYDKAYQTKPDFAQLEHERPLSRRDRLTITPENLRYLTQEQVDQIYARLTAGPLPEGIYTGGFFFADGGGMTRLAEVIKGLEGAAINITVHKLETLGRALWHGKLFSRHPRLARSLIEDQRLLARLVDDSDALPRVTLPDADAAAIDREQTRLLFPAKVYCGQSLLDGRRESIVIDSTFNDEIEHYRERPDALAGRNGLAVRDEMRMVRPGFYLGRAYLGRQFFVNFTLYNEQVAEEGIETYLAAGAQEVCWAGTQRSKAERH